MEHRRPKVEIKMTARRPTRDAVGGVVGLVAAVLAVVVKKVAVIVLVIIIIVEEDVGVVVAVILIRKLYMHRRARPSCRGSPMMDVRRPEIDGRRPEVAVSMLFPLYCFVWRPPALADAGYIQLRVFHIKSEGCMRRAAGAYG